MRWPQPGSHIDPNRFADSLTDVDTAAPSEPDVLHEDRVSVATTVVAEADADSLALRQLPTVLADADIPQHGVATTE